MENDKMNEKVGCQLFTYYELVKAWNELKNNVENDQENKNFPPDNGYDIRNGFCTTEAYDTSENQWHIPFSIDYIFKEIEKINKVITYGDLEVYWNSNELNMAETDEHGIIIEDGKIKKVY